jgi:hypothetical protein
VEWVDGRGLSMPIISICVSRSNPYASPKTKFHTLIFQEPYAYQLKTGIRSRFEDPSEIAKRVKRMETGDQLS